VNGRRSWLHSTKRTSLARGEGRPITEESMKALADYSATWQRQGQAWDAFVDAMWPPILPPPSSSLPAALTNLRIVSQ
jgi:hypothetical protein